MRIFSYWSGWTSWIERLSVASAIATGHDVTVFTYDDRAKLAAELGCRVRDAATVADDPTLADLRKRAPNHFSDHFRLEGIARGEGVWFDLDLIFIRPFPRDDYLFGWQNRHRICNAVLAMPPDSRLLTEYLAFCRKRPMIRYAMPWLPPHLKLARTLKGVMAPLLRSPPPEPKYGPPALTHFVEKCALEDRARPPHVFYPLPITESAIAGALQEGAIERLISPEETVTVHLWRSTYLTIHGRALPTKGWLAGQISELLKGGSARASAI